MLARIGIMRALNRHHVQFGPQAPKRSAYVNQTDTVRRA